MNSVTKIGDAIRGTFLVDRPEQLGPLLEAVIRKVKKQGGAFYIKNFWNAPNPESYGYVGVHIKIRMPVFTEKTYEVKGHDQTNRKKYILMEIQLHFKAIMDGTLECAKEIAHHLYKTPREDSDAIPPEIIASSQLVYLTAMTRLLSSPRELRRVDTTVKLIEAITKSERAMRLFLATALLLGDQEELRGGVWDDQLKAIVPNDKNAVAAVWRKTAETVNALLTLRSDLPIRPDNIDEWTNTATSIDELLEDARKMQPFFRGLFGKVSTSQGCTINFGPGDAHMIKERVSLQAKIKADGEEALVKLMNQLAIKVRKTLPQITGRNSVARLYELTSLNFTNDWGRLIDSDLIVLENFSSLTSLNLSGSPLITDKGLGYFGKLSGLQVLDLSKCPRLTNNGLSHLSKLPRLKTLNLSQNSLPGTGACIFLGCTISTRAKFSDEGLVHLGMLTGLENLNIGHWYELSDNGLFNLSKLTGLQTLNLYGCYHITTKGVAHVSRLGCEVQSQIRP